MMPFVELSIHRFRGGVVTFNGSLQDWALFDSSLEYCQRRRETIRRIEFQFPFENQQGSGSGLYFFCRQSLIILTVRNDHSKRRDQRQNDR